MAVKWLDVDNDVVELCQELVRLHHPDLLECSIGLIFRSEAPRSGNKQTWGAARKVSAQEYHFTKTDFVIWLAHDVWYGVLTETQQRALLDHELCHCEFNVDSRTAKTRGHDLEEFACIVERYGIWRQDIEPMAQAIQAHLPFDDQQAHNGRIRSLHALDGLVDYTLREFPTTTVERVPATKIPN